jgi:hypothetical protein
MKSWMAFRIVGTKPEQHKDLIQAETPEEAMIRAFAVFGAQTDQDRMQIFVREKKQIRASEKK